MNRCNKAPVKLTVIALFLSASWTVIAQTQPKSVPPECKTANITEQDVAREVFSKFGNWVRPVRNVSQPVMVNITLALSSINDVIERQRILRITGYISVRWFDELRVWNTTFPLNCATYVVMPASNIWLPDIAEMNAEGRYTLMELNGEKVRVYSDGYTIFSPGGTFSVFCDFDCTYFPFDEQSCAVKFESWRYTHPFMQFRFFAPNVKIYQWSENGQWSLTKTNQSLLGMSYFDPENSFDRVEFYLHLKRKSAYYLTSIVVPCVIILIAQFAIFALPVDEVQKLAILFTCLLSYLVFEMMVMDEMPSSSDHVPLLTKYLDISMALISSSILGECIVFALLRRAKTFHPDGPGFVNPWLQNVTTLAARLLCARLHFPCRPDDDHNNKSSPAVVTTTKSLPERYDDPIINNNNKITLRKTVRRLSMNVDPAFLAFKSGTFGSVNSDPDFDDISNINNNNNNNNNIIAIRQEQAPQTSAEMSHISIAKLQWQFVANVVDRITLLIYLTANVVIPVILFIIIPHFS